MRPKNLPSFSLGLLLAGLFFILCISRADAQIKIGTNGTIISPSSILELESANQGLLLPRMADTVAINSLSPPNGMLIYLTKVPAVGLYVRKANRWEFLSGSPGNGTVVDVVNGGTGQNSIPPGVLIGNGTAPVTSLTGTSGYVLTSTGPTTAPVYSAVAGGDMILSAAQTITGNKTFSDGTLILRGRAGGSTTLVPHASSSATVTLPFDGIIVNRDGIETLRNKTIFSPVLTGTPNLGSSTGTSLNISGNVTAGTFTGNLTGNVAGNATTAIRFTDPLAGDVIGIQGNTMVVQVGGQNAALIAQSAVSVGNATQANNPNTLVLRNINGDFSAGTITANLVGTVTGNLIGNASTSTRVTTNANLTGPITSTGNATAIASQTGTGTTFAMSASPAFTGIPSTPTAGTSTNNTQIASTAFVHAVVGMLKFSNVTASTSTPIDVGTSAEVSYPAAGALITGTAVVSPVGALAAGLGIASARISAANIVTVKYVNYSSSGLPLTPNINLNITVIQ